MIPQMFLTKESVGLFDIYNLSDLSDPISVGVVFIEGIDKT